MYWSEVFSHSKVAPFDLSKGSPSGEFKNYGKPASYGKSTTFTSCPVLWGKQRAVMSTIRCTRSPKREGEKKKPGRQSYRSLPHTVLPPLPQHCCGEARPWQLCHRASCCVYISWDLSLTALAVCSDALL